MSCRDKTGAGGTKTEGKILICFDPKEQSFDVNADKTDNKHCAFRSLKF